MRFVTKFALASASVLALSAPALAQDAPAEEGDDSKDIVVVGTSIRGIAPAGAQEIQVAAPAIEAKGVASTAQLLATIPQMFDFGNIKGVNFGGTRLTVTRTNIRSLPQSIGGSSPTLVLLDGHRMVGMGVIQSYPDPDVIPPLLIERVEVLTDGGSAIYGSDAVGGVLNFTTKKNFDGVMAGVRQSLGRDYRATDVNVALGKAWDTGSAYVSYNFAHHNDVFGRSRDFIKNIDWTTGLPTSLNCSPANVTVSGSLYAVVGGNSLVQGSANRCDRAKTGAFYPEETRHSVMAGFRQELSDSIEFEVKGYYSNRANDGTGGPLEGNATVTSANPNYIPVAAAPVANHSVAFDFLPVAGNSTTRTRLWAWGITPTITWKFGGDWQMKAFYNHGESKTTAFNPQTNNTLLTAAVNAGTINPYNIGAVPASTTAAVNSAAIASVLDWEEFGIGKSKLSNAKVTFDGPLFAMPGGDLRVALGGEYIKEQFAGVVVTNTRAVGPATPLNSASRNVKSAFAEASIPLVGRDMEWPIHSFNVSASVRYDKYSDFGTNWAPNFGLSLKPVDWINLRARWNKSFQAPSVVNLSNASSPTVGATPAFFVNFVPLLRNPAFPVVNGPIVAVQGTVSPLQPQRARAYNLGIDISPPMLKGLDLHLTYFNIDYRGTIGQPALGFGEFYTIPAYQSLYIMQPTIAQVQTFLAGAGASATDITNMVAAINQQGGQAYVVADVRQRNLGTTKQHGFDISANYRHDVSFGTVYANFNSTFLTHSVTAADGTTFTVEQAGLDGGRFNSSLDLGVTGDDFRAQVTWYHRSGYRLSAAAQLGQTTVGAFNTFDLFLEKTIQDKSIPITLSLRVENLFDKAPPIFRGASSSGNVGYANGNPLGRVFQLGASVKF